MMSARLPIEAKEESPRLRSPARAISASPRAPLCDRKATFPAGGMAGAKVALSRTPGTVLMSPRQLGPISRIPDSRQLSTRRRSRSAPSGPDSAKPAEITVSAGTPFAAQSATTPSTAGAGTAITARSTGPGTSVTLP